MTSVQLFIQMKLPASLGQKKTKAIEQVLEDLGLGEFSSYDRKDSINLYGKLYFV